MPQKIQLATPYSLLDSPTDFGEEPTVIRIRVIVCTLGISYLMPSGPSLIGRRQHLLPCECKSTTDYVAQFFIGFGISRSPLEFVNP